MHYLPAMHTSSISTSIVGASMEVKQRGSTIFTTPTVVAVLPTDTFGLLPKVQHSS